VIYIDSTELTDSSRLPKIPQARRASGLEALTGADLLITPLSKAPKSARIVQRHVEAGALFVQRKSTADLVQSLQDERIYRQIVRMRALDIDAMQCVLLFAGMFLPNKRGKLRVGTFDGTSIKWRHSKVSYAAFRARLSKLSDTVRVVQLSHDEEIASWAVERERHIKGYAEGDRVKHVYSRPLREMKAGDEFWYNLTISRQCGIVKARAIGEHLERMGCGTFARAIEYLSDERNASLPRPQGVGIRTWAEFRAILGLPPDYIMRIVHRDELKST